MDGKVKMQKTIIGFIPEHSPIYKLHPLVRLAMFLAMSIIPLFVEIPEINIILLLLTLVLFYYSKVDLKKLKIYLPMIFTVGFFIFLTYIFFPIAKGEKILIWQFGNIRIYYNSIIWGLSVYFRIIVLVYVSIFYFSTNRERDILIAFRSIGTPFIITYFIGLSLRAAGMFMEDYKIMREAEEARGLAVEELSFLGKVKHFSMYMIPLFTIAIRRSEEISIALYSKGTTLSSKINGAKRPDYLLYKYPIKNIDKISTIAILSFMVGFGLLELYTGIFSLKNSPLNITLLNLLKGGS